MPNNFGKIYVDQYCTRTTIYLNVKFENKNSIEKVTTISWHVPHHLQLRRYGRKRTNIYVVVTALGLDYDFHTIHNILFGYSKPIRFVRTSSDFSLILLLLCVPSIFQ